MDSADLTLIDAGITSLTNDVVLHPNLVTLNLHCNYITTITNLNHLQCLQHLDLSSNQIKVIKGLDKLINLKTLNLACNQIKKVQGLGKLTKLTTVNLSYNCIEDVSEFGIFAGQDYKLERVDLQGNKVSSQKMVIDAFSGCVSLRVLNCRSEGVENPVCSTKNYRQNVLRALNQVQILDSKDRAGNLISGSVDIPGLDDYLAQILPSSSSENMIPISTPNIDAALDSYKQRSVVNVESSENDSSESKQAAQKQELDRLHRIEEQLAKLLQSREENEKSVKRQPKRDTDLTDESDSTDGPQRSSSQCSKRKIPEKKLSKTPPSRRILKGSRPTAKAEDEKMKSEMQSTYQHLVEDLNSERERRFKAEHAAKQLAERVKQLQLESKLMDEKQGIAVEASGKLKEAFIEQREKCKSLEEENSSLKQQLMNVQERLEESKEAHQSTLTAMKTMEESLAKIESEKMSTNAHYTKMIHDADARASASHREVDLLRVQLKENKATIQQLQQLLASREQEHIKQLEQRYALGSPEIRELLQNEAGRVEALYQGQISNLQSKIDSANCKYRDLEDEFRDALYIEANRYDKLREAFEKAQDENEQNRSELINLRNKDEKATQLITELTQLVKEQKGRIAELAKSKHDQMFEQKERIQALEAHLEEARRRLVQFELLKKDNKRLQAQYDGQESVIEGLRAERKLWSQELAQQGSSLAQDRGRLEAKIEALTNEINYLKKQLEKEVDSLKIKTKLIDDQTDTIRNLKEALLERDEQVKTVRQEMVDVQKKLENELCDEKQAYRDAQDMIQDLTDRKEDLKNTICGLEAELENERENHSKINNKWKEKSDLIGHLESQVFEMKAAWEKKEKELENEKEKALRAANLAIDKMRQMDAAFKKQYESTKKNHDAELEKIVVEKDMELEAARDRVMEVENEMRVLLKEHEDGKRLAEERMRKMASAFSELQQQWM